jgi:tRNA threonylcarbamoyladenosine biosynthesis protein TsaB
MGSVALALGAKMLAEGGFSTPLRHSAEIFPAIRDLLDRVGRDPSEIEHVYVSCGPGSFSGLRIAATIAKMMNLANAARIVAVDTLDVVAANVVDLTGTGGRSIGDHQTPAANCQRLAAVLDAKRGRFFIAVYERQAKTQDPGPKPGVWRKVLADSLMTIAEFLARFADGQARLPSGGQEPVWLLGDGLVYYQDSFRADGIQFFEQTYWSPQARNVHVLGWHKALNGQFADPLTLTPNYLRTPDITMKSR